MSGSGTFAVLQVCSAADMSVGKRARVVQWEWAWGCGGRIPPGLGGGCCLPECHGVCGSRQILQCGKQSYSDASAAVPHAFVAAGGFLMLHRLLIASPLCRPHQAGLRPVFKT